MNTPSLFGAVQMGYVLVESNRLREWQRFLHQGIGFHLAASGDEAIALRMDDHARRIVVRRGDAEDLVAVGLQLRDRPTLDAVLARLAERGIDVTPGDGTQAALRGVKAFWQVEGPKRLAVELFVDPVRTDEPLHMLAGGFVTGAGGFGHVAITSRRPATMQRFWQELFDARVSDTIEDELGGVMLDITFLRFNERHHSIAIAATRGVRVDPIRTKAQHISFLASSMDDVAGAFRRLKDLGFTMAHEIGQHPNDREISFYAIGPSGFEIELGCDALVVDEATWKPTSYHGISLWGHKPPNPTLAHGLRVNAGNLKRGVASLLHPEYSPI
ncbi:MAG TPA: VOC family protein [Nevskiaceae bacterium]|nr:VOC family protein [Nevskiaceae bacterium]